jgi:hypothetical protein
VHQLALKRKSFGERATELRSVALVVGVITAGDELLITDMYYPEKRIELNTGS